MQQRNEWVVKHAQRTRRFAVVFAVVALSSMVFAGFAFTQRKRAEVSGRNARVSATEAAVARTVAEQKSKLADEQSKLAEERRKEAEANAENLRQSAIELKAAKEKAEAESRRAKRAIAGELEAVRKLEKQKTDEANLVAQAALIIANAVILESDGEVLQRDNKLDEALDKYQRASKVFLQFGMNGRAEHTLTRMAAIYHAQGKLQDEQTARDAADKLPRSIAGVLRKTISEKGIEPALQEVRGLKKNQPNKYYFNESELNTLGYDLLKINKVKEAIEVFKLNVEAYPKAYNTYDSLGEAYMIAGDKERAIENYKKTLELNPKKTEEERTRFAHAVDMLKKLGVSN